MRKYKEMYVYKAPLIRRLHKCHYCKRRLSDVPKDEMVARLICVEEGCGIDCFYCDDDCARSDKNKETIIKAERQELNDYIEGAK